MIKRAAVCTGILIASLIAGAKSSDYQFAPRSIVEEFLIDRNIEFTNARGDQWSPAIAFDGINYLLVWTDKRNAPTDSTRCKYYDIYYARVSPSGEVLDPSNIFIATTNMTEFHKLSVAFDGVNFLVVWVDNSIATALDIIGARITTSGAVIDQNGIIISSAPGDQDNPTVAFTGQNFFVAWEDGRNQIDNDIYGTRVTPAGLVLDPDGIIISSAIRNQSNPNVTNDGINYFAVWEDNRVDGQNYDILGTRINQSGVVLDPDGIRISTAPGTQACPSVVYGGANYFIAWQDDRSSADIYGARVTSTGTVLDPDGIAISVAPQHQKLPDVAYDGMNYLVVWQDVRAGGWFPNDIYGARVDQSGTVLDPDGIPINTLDHAQSRPSLCYSGVSYLVVYDDLRDNIQVDVYGSRVTQDGIVLDPIGILISKQIYTQALSASSFDGANFFTIYEDFRNNGNCDIYGSRINISGEILDPGGIPITTEPFIQGCPDIAYDGNNYLAIWHDTRREDYRDIYGTRVDRIGNVIDYGGIPIAIVPDDYVYQYPALVFGGTNYFVVWETRWAYGGSGIRGSRVSTDGIPLDPNGIIITGAFTTSPKVSFDGINYFVVWTYNPSSINPDIYSTRVSQEGIVIDPNPGIPISAVPNSAQQFPAIAFDGNNYLVVWEDNRSDIDYDIYGARVSPSGTVLDPYGIPIAVQPGNQIRPKVSFNSSQYVVVWEDVNSGDLIGTKVSSAGIVDPIFPVSTSPGWQYEPAITHGPEDLMLVTFTGWVPEYGNYRIWGKLIGEHTLWTDDPLALAYNGNRHLVRKPNTQEFHLVYTDGGHVIYRYSSNGGTDWTLPFIVGDGAYPAIALDGTGLPVVAWIDGEQYLCYRRQYSAGNWSNFYSLYYSGGYGIVNSSLSPPSIAVTYNSTTAVDTVNILVSVCWNYHDPINGNTWTNLLDIAYPITNPNQMTIYDIVGDAGYLTLYPSVAKDFSQTLHCAWQWQDVIYYATRQQGQEWNNWGDVFDPEGHQSAHPFVETYGDSVFVVWQHIEPPTMKEDIYRAWRHLTWDHFEWNNLSQTFDKISLYPVNASGLVTTFMDEPEFVPPDSRYEIFWKTKPVDPLHNISQSPDIKSTFPHTTLRIPDFTTNVLSVAWQEGNESPFEIKFKQLPISGPISAYLSSPNGYEIPSSYLIQRDTSFTDWPIPVDAGYETIAYQFPLEPGFRYKLRTVAYHQSSGEWREWFIIDGKEQHLIKYNAYEPETLDIWLPPAFYRDSVVEVVYSRIKGNYATAGPICIYRIEGEEGEGGGPMAQESYSIEKTALTVSPNPFVHDLSLRFQNQKESELRIKIYDVTGRLVKNLFNGSACGSFVYKWNGDDESGRPVAQGVYFVRIDNLSSAQISVHKVLKVR